MATANPKMFHETDDEIKLEAESQALIEKMKAMFEKIREANEDLGKMREELRLKQDKLQQINKEREKDQRERHESGLEAQKKTEQVESPAELKSEGDPINEQVVALSNERINVIEKSDFLRRENSEQNEWLIKLDENLQSAMKYSRKQQKDKIEKAEEIEKLTRRIKCLEDGISTANIQLTTGNEQLKADRNKHVMEVQVLQRKASERNESLATLNENVQNTTSLLKTLQKEKRKADADNMKLRRRIKCLEEEISAAQLITTETQLRQLDELQTLIEETRELKQTLSTQHHHQQQQQQQVNGEHHKSKLIHFHRMFKHQCMP